MKTDLDSPTYRDRLGGFDTDQLRTDLIEARSITARIEQLLKDRLILENGIFVDDEVESRPVLEGEWTPGAVSGIEVVLNVKGAGRTCDHIRYHLYGGRSITTVAGEPLVNIRKVES